MKYVTLPMEEYEAMVAEIEALKRRKDAPLPDMDDVLMPTKLFVILERMGIKNLSQIEDYTKADYTRQPGLGRKTFQDLQTLMFQYGLSFKN